MKKPILSALFGIATAIGVQAQEYKVITTVESIAAGGVGRSRIIENKSDINFEELTTERTDGNKSGLGKVKRKGIKVDKFSETKLLNFYSMMGGINFRNIASNDAVMSDRINNLVKQGWKLEFVTSAVESDGIFITRYIFRK